MTVRSPLRSLHLVVLVLVVVGAVCAFGPRPAHGQSVALSTRASTLGIGGDVTVQLSSTFNVRAGGSYFPIRHSGVLEEEVNVQYDVEARLAAALLLVDWHPFGNALRMSLGGIYNGTQVKGRARPVDSYTVQQKTFQPERLGRLEAEASFASKINPYVGIGVGNAVQGSPVDVFLDLGAMYVVQPEVRMTGTGLISATTNHESTLNEGLRSFHILPYFSLGVSYKL